MINFNAYVIEIEPDTCYKVCIDGLISTTVTDCGDIDDSAVSFESALSSIVELMLGDDYEITFVKETRLKLRPRRCRGYVVSVNYGD